MIVDKIKKRELPQKNKKTNIDIPIGKWVKCAKCKEIISKTEELMLWIKEKLEN